MCFGQIVDDDAFDGFLQSVAQDHSLGNRRFVARNFFLDEGVSPERQRSYEAAGVAERHAGYGDWEEVHEDYLLHRVFLGGPYQMATQIDKADEENCPETFRHQIVLRAFGGTDVNLDLIRAERVERIAQGSGLSSMELLSLAQEVMATPSFQQIQKLNSALETWGRNREQGPVWAVFWEEMADLFASDSTYEPADWPNELRDRLGLYHWNPASRSQEEIYIFVFRYPVSVLPPLKGERDLRPIAVPTVLDGHFSEAFCPVPSGQPYGFVIYLGQQPYRLQRELLHPSIQFRAEHLFRVGTVTCSPPADLTGVRRNHLQRLRAETNRTDYAIDTDGDLL